MIKIKDLNVNNNAYIDDLNTRQINVDDGTSISKDKVITTNLEGNLKTDYLSQGDNTLILDGGDQID